MTFLQGALIILSVPYITCDGGPLLTTPLGKIRGFTMTSRDGKSFFAFKGIPYAKPPVGVLRFQPPSPVDPWSGVLETTKDGPLCIQVPFYDPKLAVAGVEDCLYLSVFTSNVSGHAPVLFHIHGGAYTAGNSFIYGPEYLMDEEIVLVKINYRVGIFGFLSFEDRRMPGNQAMKDQVMGLRWVQENIASFGGDPNLVTLIGESAGGGSVYNHIVSPMSRGLFHRGITQSGSSYTPWGLSPPGLAKKNAGKLLSLVNCPINMEDGIKCLMKKESEEIASKFKYFMEWQIDPVSNFGPVLEPEGADAFLVGPVSQWQHNPVPLMMGLNSAEGLLRTSIMLQFRTDFKWFSDNFDNLAPISLLYFASASKPNEITQKIRKFYFPNQNFSINDWINVTTMYTDSWFSTGILDGANNHKGDVYFYYFDYVSQGKSVFGQFDEKLNFGAFHCADMALIWNLSVPLVPTLENEDEISLSKQFIKYLITFMKHGTPEVDNISWNKWTPNDHSYLHFARDGLHSKKGLLEERYRFWKSLPYRDNLQ